MDPLRASVSKKALADRPTKTDSLGFVPYVRAIADFLTDPDTKPPLTMSVEGEWGSGKSSFMLQLEDLIKEKGGKTVWFNAWRHERDEELWAAFALDFTSKLGQTLSWLDRLCVRIKLIYFRFDLRRGWPQLARFVALTAFFIFLSYSIGQYVFGVYSPVAQLFERARNFEEEFKWPDLAARMLVGVGGIAGYLVLLLALLRAVSEMVGNPLKIRFTEFLRNPKYETRAAFIETFHSDFERLVRAYSEGKKIFVFIDDLDRCEIPKSAELMQALNLLISESTPVFYILGLDREKIAAGLAAKYEKLLPYLAGEAGSGFSTQAFGVEFGYSFLEKFIQIPFLLPRPTSGDLEKLLDNLGGRKSNSVEEAVSENAYVGLRVDLSTDSDVIVDILRMVSEALDFNPRRLKQFLNLFRLRAFISSQTGLFGQPRQPHFSTFTLEQLGKLVAIMLRWPLFLVDVSDDPTLLRRLQDRAWSVISLETSSDSKTQYWAAKRNLLDLIAFPIRGDFTPSEQIVGQYGLAEVDIERFLQTSPVIRWQDVHQMQGSSIGNIAGRSDGKAEATGDLSTQP
jgi:hypothetical protein